MFFLVNRVGYGVKCEVVQGFYSLFMEKACTYKAQGIALVQEQAMISLHKMADKGLFRIFVCNHLGKTMY